MEKETKKTTKKTTKKKLPKVKLEKTEEKKELITFISKEIYLDLVSWKALPRGKTAPKNILEFAENQNISVSALREKMKDPQFAEDVRIEALRWSKMKIPEIMQLLYEEIKLTKSTTDAERFMKIAYESERKEKDQGNQINIINTNLSDEQYRKILAREARVLGTSSDEQAD